MLTEQIVRDVWEVHNRLFDHRPILQGHIKAFVREFEEKRGDREIERLQQIEARVGTMKGEVMEDTRTTLDTHLSNILAKLKVAIEVCNKIEEKEDKIEVGYLEVERETRREKWDAFMQEQFDKSAQVDQEMDEQMRALQIEYAQLEKNLEFVTTAPP